MGKSISKVVALTFSVLVICSAVAFYASAWTEPNGSPPDNNAAAPLNTSITGQQKLGGLVLNLNGAPYGLIVAAGNVGIGTASPGAPLDVVSPDLGTTGGLRVRTSSSNVAPAYIQFTDNPVTTQLGLIKVATSSNMGLFTAGTERITILNSNGNVGIGTTNPGAKLEVAGQVKITGGSPGAGRILSSDSTGLASWITPSSNVMYLEIYASHDFDPNGYGCSRFAPAACPSGWTQADLQTVPATGQTSSGGTGSVSFSCLRTCYRTNAQCQVMVLEIYASHDFDPNGYGCSRFAPAACPSGWTQADLQTVSVVGASSAKYFNCRRTCYLCQ